MTTDTEAMVTRLDAVSLLVRDAVKEGGTYRWPVLRAAWTRECPWPHRGVTLSDGVCSDCGEAFAVARGRVPLPWAELLRYDGAVRGVLEEALEAGGWSLGPLLPVGPTAWEAHLITPEGSQGYRGHGPTKALARLAATEQALGA
jgi:hypothetical protein